MLQEMYSSKPKPAQKPSLLVESTQITGSTKDSVLVQMMSKNLPTPQKPNQHIAQTTTDLSKSGMPDYSKMSLIELKVPLV